MNLKKQISPLGAICLCGLMITGCGHRTSSISNENTNFSLIDQTEYDNKDEVIDYYVDYLKTCGPLVKQYDNGYSGLVIRFTNVTSDGCTIEWDSFSNKNVHYTVKNYRINNSYYGSTEFKYTFVGDDSDLKPGIVFDGVDYTYPQGDHLTTGYIRLCDWYVGGFRVCGTKNPAEATSGEVNFMEYSPEKHEDEPGFFWASNENENGTSETLENKESFQGHTYQFFDTPMSWSSAEEMCVSLGGHLISINSMEEQSFAMRLTKNANAENIWTGGYYNTLKKKWLWTDGSDFSYTNWDVWYNYEGEAVSQPDNWSGDEYCIRYANQSIDFGDYYVNFGGWLDTANESDGNEGDAPLSTFGFICEWSD